MVLAGTPARLATSPMFMTRLAVEPPLYKGSSYWKVKARAALFLLAGLAFEDAHQVAFLHHQQLVAVELDLGARPFAEQHAVAGFDLGRMPLAVVVARARPDRDHFAFLRLFLGGVGDDDAAGGLFLLLEAADHDAIVQRTELHACLPGVR